LVLPALIGAGAHFVWHEIFTAEKDHIREKLNGRALPGMMVFCEEDFRHTRWAAIEVDEPVLEEVKEINATAVTQILVRDRL